MYLSIKCSRQGVVLVSLLAMLLAPACAGEEETAGELDEEFSDFHLVDNDLALAWNELAQDIAFAEDQFLTFKGVRALSMMHLAMHDSLNAVFPRYEQYAYQGFNPFADPIAAAAQAAHDVLASQYTQPAQLAQIDAELAFWLNQVPNGLRKTRGITVGAAAADENLEVREGDGYDFQGTYTFQSGPGKYQNTPPFMDFVVQPGFRFARPFGLSSPSQFRPPPPPSLGSSAWAADYNEVKAQGRIDSTTRTADQTGYALWWMEFTEGSMNRLGRQLAEDEDIGLWPATRMFALLNMTMFDGYVSNWDSKYQYNFWRPYTAIRAGDTDGNAATAPDPTWENLIQFTPPHPEYASAHSTVCATSMTVFAEVFGNNTSFTMTTTTAPPGMPTRSFTKFSTAALECADSRVQLGFHFRSATNQGNLAGKRVAEHIIDRKLEPNF
jgi:hypothetical protein